MLVVVQKKPCQGFCGQPSQQAQLSEYEAAQEEREFMRAVVTGLADVEAGRVLLSEEVKRFLGLADG